MSGDYLRLEGNKNFENFPGPRGFDLSNLALGRELAQKIFPGAEIGLVSDNLPQCCPMGGGGGGNA